MASPWKLLARLVAPRRRQRGEDYPLEAVEPNAAPIASLTENPGTVDRADGPSYAHLRLDDAASDNVADGSLEKDNGNVGKDVGGFLASIIPNKTRTAAKAASPKRKGRTGKVESPAAAVQPPQVARTISEEMASLDEEIRTFREQLASKLRLQNAQLKTMLERYER